MIQVSVRLGTILLMFVLNSILFFHFLLFYNCAKPHHHQSVTKWLHPQTLGSCVLVVLRGRENSMFPDSDTQVTVLRVMALHSGLKLTRCLLSFGVILNVSNMFNHFFFNLKPEVTSFAYVSTAFLYSTMLKCYGWLTDYTVCTLYTLQFFQLFTQEEWEW